MPGAIATDIVHAVVEIHDCLRYERYAHCRTYCPHKTTGSIPSFHPFAAVQLARLTLWDAESLNDLYPTFCKNAVVLQGSDASPTTDSGQFYP